MSRIYISYREGDVPEWMPKVFEHLTVCFGEGEVIGSAQASSAPSANTVTEQVSVCEALVVLIGPRWAKGTESGSPGLRDPEDRIRLEMETALAENLLIVPVPLDNTPQPLAQDLPDSLTGLLRQSPVPLTSENLQKGLAELTHRLEAGLALKTIIQNSSLKRRSIHHRELPHEDLLGFTSENRPQDTFGLEHSNLSDTRRAIDYQETALNLARESKDLEAESIALSKLGLALGKMGETGRAIECFERQLAIEKELGRIDSQGDLLANLGDAWAVRGEFSRAIPYYNEQLGLALTLEDRDMEAASQVGLGHCHIKIGEIERGVQFYERALSRIRQTGEAPEQARLLVGLGLNYRKLGKTQEAVESLKKALELARRLGDRREESCLMEDIADTYEELGETALAIGFREQQLEIAKELDDAALEGRILLSMARANHRLDNRDRAMEQAQSALDRVTLVDAVLRSTIENQIELWEENAENN